MSSGLFGACLLAAVCLGLCSVQPIAVPAVAHIANCCKELVLGPHQASNHLELGVAKRVPGLQRSEAVVAMAESSPYLSSFRSSIVTAPCRSSR